jgi:hypothetical protein
MASPFPPSSPTELPLLQDIDRIFFFFFFSFNSSCSPSDLAATKFSALGDALFSLLSTFGFLQSEIVGGRPFNCRNHPNGCRSKIFIHSLRNLIPSETKKKEKKDDSING